MSRQFHSHVVPKFLSFLGTFKRTPLWWDMVNTRENTPDHREPNVADHTLMVIDWYLVNKAALRSEPQRCRTLFACLFHDISKGWTNTNNAVESSKAWLKFVDENDLSQFRLSQPDKQFISDIIKRRSMSVECSDFILANELGRYVDMSGDGDGHDK